MCGETALVRWQDRGSCCSCCVLLGQLALCLDGSVSGATCFGRRPSPPRQQVGKGHGGDAMERRPPGSCVLTNETSKLVRMNVLAMLQQQQQRRYHKKVSRPTNQVRGSVTNCKLVYHNRAHPFLLPSHSLRRACHSCQSGGVLVCPSSPLTKWENAQFLAKLASIVLLVY
jgi:hypothetical protein